MLVPILSYSDTKQLICVKTKYPSLKETTAALYTEIEKNTLGDRSIELGTIKYSKTSLLVTESDGSNRRYQAYYAACIEVTFGN